jgi:hypothetical protein
MQLKINQYDTVETGHYQGKWQIKVGRVDEHGKFWPHFQSIKKKDGSQINVPVSLTFDDYKDRIEFLSLCSEDIGEDNLLAFIANQADLLGYELVKKEPMQPPTDDVPF